MPHRTFTEWCRRYLSVNALLITAALVYVLFLNDNSILNHYEYKSEIADLERRIADSRDSLAHYQDLNSRLETDRRTMEMIVREQYHMQRPSEDIYLVK